LLTISPEFEWPAKSKLTLKMNGIINPDIPLDPVSGKSLTGIFEASTEYDGV